MSEKCILWTGNKEVRDSTTKPILSGLMAKGVIYGNQLTVFD